MGDHISMSISVHYPSDETLNQGRLALLLQRQYEFPFRINIVQFSIFKFFNQEAGSAVPKLAIDVKSYFKHLHKKV